jgi:ABC-2 type transport system ATP-binding protein
MYELEQLEGRIVMIDHGHIAFDGDFRRLRSGFGDHRYLMLETPQESAPELTGATWSHSEGNRHTFTFDAAQTPIAMLLDRAAQQTQVVDVETHRAPIDDVIADIYEGWENERAD